MLLSVIVTTYNRPDALAAVLEGLLAQRDAEPASSGALGASSLRFEALVADDGSGEPTRELVESFRPRFRGALEHVWHEDAGFRAGAIRNRAAAKSRGDLLVFLDGDCIPRTRFVAAHARAARPRSMMRGSRALLSEPFTNRVLAERLPLHDRSAASWIRARLRGEVNRVSGLIALPWSRTVGAARREWRGVRTCNLAVWRTDFERLNGFDERFVGWGYEDSDLAIRGLNDGVLVRRTGPECTVLHLWHRENDRRFEGENLARLEATRRSGAVRAPIGLAEGGVTSAARDAGSVRNPDANRAEQPRHA
ncbi:MAG: glycosyltransferase [Phycisphaerae bacterium]|nr:glycosyltransferase [Phycisphaerae bacterium]